MTAMKNAYEMALPGEGERDSAIVARAFGSGERVAPRAIASGFVGSFAFQHPAHARKWSDDVLDKVVEHIQENPTASLQQLIDYAEKELGAARVAESSLATYLDGKLITYKQVVVHNQERNCGQVKEDGKAYVNQAQALIGQGFKFVALDESGLSLGLHNAHGRSPSGSDAILIGPRSAGRNESVYCAVAGGIGVVHAAHRPGAYNAVTFEAEFKTIVEKCIDMTLRKVVFIADNCRIHNKQVLPTVIARVVGDAHAAGRGTFDYKLIFLPRYSPMFNFIEGSFNDLKGAARRQLDGPLHQELLDLIHQEWGMQGTARADLLSRVIDLGLQAITGDIVSAHEVHAVSQFPKALLGEDL